MKKLKTLSTKLTTIIFFMLCMTFAVSAEEAVPESNITYEIYPEIGVMIMSGEGEMKYDFFGIRKEDMWLPVIPPSNDVDVDDRIYSEEFLKFYDEILNVKTLIINEGITTIGGGTFACGDFGFRNLENVILPESLKEIEDGAFYGCYKLKKINIPIGTIIGKYAFDYTGITSLNVSENQNYISLEYLSSLKELRASANAGYVFSCDNLEEIIIDTKNNNKDDNVWHIAGCEKLKVIRILSMTDSFKLRIEWCPNVKVICYQGAKIIDQLEKDKIPYEVITPTVKALGKVKNIKTESLAATGFKISWDSVKNAGYYQVDVYDSKTKSYVTQYTGAKTTVTVSQRVAPYNTNLKIRIRACCFDGDEYIYSDYTDYEAYNVQYVSFTITLTSAQAATLSWNAVKKVDGYQIYWSTNNKNYKKLATVKEKSYKVSELEKGKTYYFKLRAYKKLNNGDTAYSYFVTEVVFISGLKASSTSKGKVTLTWSKIPDYQIKSYKSEKFTYKYQLYYSTDGKTYKKLAKTDKTSYTKSGLTSGKTYYFKMATLIVSNGNEFRKLPDSKAVKIKVK